MHRRLSPTLVPCVLRPCPHPALGPLPAAPQVRVWSTVESYAAAAARIQEALDADVPQHLAEARAQLEEARREHDALQQAVEGKVGGQWWECVLGQCRARAPALA